jgi:hypothetical protein
MSAREGDARPGFQVALKGDGAALVGELDDEVN